MQGIRLGNVGRENRQLRVADDADNASILITGDSVIIGLS